MITDLGRTFLDDSEQDNDTLRVYFIHEFVISLY